MVNCSYCNQELKREVFCSGSHKVMFHKRGRKLGEVVLVEKGTPIGKVEAFQKLVKNTKLPKPKKKEKIISKPIVTPKLGLPRGDMDADNYL